MQSSPQTLTFNARLSQPRISLSVSLSLARSRKPRLEERERICVKSKRPLLGRVAEQRGK